jgi:NDP-sugar pyrophosphorylase family protein
MKRAIILAGGKGTRLKPYTISMPKPLVPIGGKPILERIIITLRTHGFNHITVTVNHMAEMIMSYFEDGSKWDVKIDYSLERSPLSTMGPLKLIQDLPDDFLVLNGDVLTDLDLSLFFENHIHSSSMFTISSSKRIEKVDYGVLHIGDSFELLNFEEKPNFEFQVSMGVYMLNKSVLDYIPIETFFGFDHLMKCLLTENVPVKVIEHKGFWLDIGRPSDYEFANDNYEKNLL